MATAWRSPSTHLAAYDPIGDRYRKGLRPPAGQPARDPDRGGQLIVETLLRENAPFRLLLGSDAVEAAQAAWEAGSGSSRPGRGQPAVRWREGGETMILCVNTYRVKPGQRDALVADLVQEGIADQLQGLPGNVFFVFSLPIQDPEGLCLTDAWEDEAGLPGPLEPPGHPALGNWKATYITDSQVRRYDL